MQRIETNSVVMERVGPDLVVCRYKTGVRVNAAVLQENLMARKLFAGPEPFGVIGILPEDLDFDTSLVGSDVYAGGIVDRETHALALVVEGDLLEKLAALYLKYHPTKFPCQVFARYADAVKWVGERIAMERKS